MLWPIVELNRTKLFPMYFCFQSRLVSRTNVVKMKMLFKDSKEIGFITFRPAENMKWVLITGGIAKTHHSDIVLSRTLGICCMLSPRLLCLPITRLVKSQGRDTGLEDRVFFFFFCCTGSSLLHVGFLQLWRVGAPLQLRCVGSSSRWLLLLPSTSSLHTGVRSWGSWS